MARSAGVGRTEVTEFLRRAVVKLHEIQARNLDPQALKRAWIEMSDEADAKITHLADTLPDTPIGVAFVDAAGMPGWPGDTPGLTIHHPSIRGCLPRVDGMEPEILRER